MTTTRIGLLGGVRENARASGCLLGPLDQWCYAGMLVWDRAKKLNDENAGCYKFLHSPARNGSVIFPLSQAHYRETWKRENTDARWDTAVMMGELSGFHTLNVSGLAEWEALKCVSTYAKSAHKVATPNVIGWGLKNCLSGHGKPASTMDMRTGKPANWSALPDGQQRAIADLERETAYLFELAMLARRIPPLPYNLAVDARLNEHSSCRIVHRLPELCDLLRNRLGLS